MTLASRLRSRLHARDNAILLVPKSERDAEVWIFRRDAARRAERGDARVPRDGQADRRGTDEADPKQSRRPTATRAVRRSRSSATSKVNSISRGMTQEVPDVKDLLETEDDAPIHPHDQRAVHAGGTRRCERHRYRSRSRAIHWSVPCRRHVARRGATEARTARGAGLAHQDMAALDIAEKPCRRTSHHTAGRRPRCRCPGTPCRPATANARCCVCWKKTCKTSS